MKALQDWRRVRNHGGWVCVACSRDILPTQIAVEVCADLSGGCSVRMHDSECWAIAIATGNVNPRARVINARGAEPWDVYVGRGVCPVRRSRAHARFANPFSVKEHGGEALRLFVASLHRNPDQVSLACTVFRGMSIGCSCGSGLCHAYAWAMLANGESLADVDQWVAEVVPRQIDLFSIAG